MQLSAVIRKDGRLFVAWCPELDVASQGRSSAAALKNLKEAVSLFLDDPHVTLPKKRAILTTFEAGDGEASRALRA
jgi:predicted RNase H-like HicB family nuclease